MSCIQRFPIAWLAALIASVAISLPAVAQTPPSFERAVAPILIKRCLECHGETDPSGKLNLTTRDSIMKGGESGPAVTAFEANQSLLYTRVRSGEMPPPKRGHSQKLPENEAATLGVWIVFGCQWPEGRKLDLFESTNETRAGRDWWSLQPVRRPNVPTLVSSPPSSGEWARVRGPMGENASVAGNAGSNDGVTKHGRSPNQSPTHPNPLPPKAGGEGTKPLLSNVSPANPPFAPQPSTIDPQPVRSPLDVFIVSKLIANDMEPAPQADRATLIKRLSFDLLGLPPSFEDVEAFVSDSAPDAYERLVDRLLASPHFGERWARYWLDLVRYADTCGYERDQEKPGAWKYRDWVVRAINEDLPYARFIIEQLAGDELPDRNEQTLIATGFLRLGTWNDEPNDAEEYKYDRLEDLVGATSTAFLGYTVKCARCHDHKFDPIQQADYYRMAAAFWPGPIEQRDRELLGGPSREELDAALSPANKPLMPDILAWTDIRPAPPIHLLKKGEPKHPGAVVEPAAMSFVPGLSESRVESRGSRARVEQKPSTVKTPSSSPLALDSPLSALRSFRRTALAEWIVHPDNPLTARVLVNRLWTHHFGRGLVRSPDNFGFTGDKPTHPELLEWLSAECRVTSVREADAGERVPSVTRHSTLVTPHFLKRLHRLLVTSATYRQSSLHPKQDEYTSRDAANHLWWHAERRRLDAESLRDRMLFMGESLDTRMAGPGFKVTIQAEALEGLSRKGDAWKPSPSQEQRRRSLYSFSARSLLPPLMTTFDFGDTTLPCGQRPVSTVAPQALALLNNAFAHERSTALATVVWSLRRPNVPSAERRDDDTDTDQQARLAWRLALGREPSPGELAAAREHVAAQRQRFSTQSSDKDAGRTNTSHDPDFLALASLCHVLLNTNEFAYVD